MPEMQETPVQPLGWEDALEKETATHSHILAWRNPRTEKPGLHASWAFYGGGTEVREEKCLRLSQQVF